jgi:hypothetical protein
MARPLRTAGAYCPARSGCATADCMTGTHKLSAVAVDMLLSAAADCSGWIERWRGNARLGDRLVGRGLLERGRKPEHRSRVTVRRPAEIPGMGLHVGARGGDAAVDLARPMSPMSGVVSSSLKSSTCSGARLSGEAPAGGKVEVVRQRLLDGEPRIESYASMKQRAASSMAAPDGGPGAFRRPVILALRVMVGLLPARISCDGSAVDAPGPGAPHRRDEDTG